MTRFIVISVDAGRLYNMRRLLPQFEVFTGTSGCTQHDYRQVCIPDTYKRLAEWAVEDGLGRESVVLMDDVWIPNGPGFDGWQRSFDVPLLILGHDMDEGFVDPRAFSATPEIWVELSKVWRGEGRIWRDWDPVVKEYGMNLNLTKFLD